MEKYIEQNGITELSKKLITITTKLRYPIKLAQITIDCWL